MNYRIQRNLTSKYKDPNTGYKSVSFRANPKEVKKLEEIQEMLKSLKLNNSTTNAFRVIFHHFNLAEYRNVCRQSL
jgi:hypothetical protein